MLPVPLEAPRLSRAFDLDAAVAACPDSITIKGLFFADVLRALGDRPPPPSLGSSSERGAPRGFVPFKDYPYQRYMRLIGWAAGVLFPHEPLLQGIRAIARNAFPTYAETLLGKVVFGVARSDVDRVIALGTKAYAAAMPQAVVEILTHQRGLLLARLSNIYLPVDGPHLGAIEGAILACRRQVTSVRVGYESDTAGLVEVTWE